MRYRDWQCVYVSREQKYIRGRGKAGESELSFPRLKRLCLARAKSIHDSTSTTSFASAKGKSPPWIEGKITKFAPFANQFAIKRAIKNIYLIVQINKHRPVTARPVVEREI